MIDAALYVMGSDLRAHPATRGSCRPIRSAGDDATGLAIVRQALEPRFGSYGWNEDREQFYRSLRGMVVHTETTARGVTADDLRSAAVVFVLVVATALPPAVPFLLIADPVVALRVSNAVLVALLFVVGFYWARSIGGSGWRTGLVMMLSGRAARRHRHCFRRMMANSTTTTSAHPASSRGGGRENSRAAAPAGQPGALRWWRFDGLRPSIKRFIPTRRSIAPWPQPDPPFSLPSRSCSRRCRLAQDSVTEFRLAQDPKNIQGCTALDSSFTRAHTSRSGAARPEVKSAGGIDDKMKLVRPNVYETVFALSGVRLDVVADLSATPKTLTDHRQEPRLQVDGGPAVAAAEGRCSSIILRLAFCSLSS